jgi:hypothetical protein
MEDSFLLLNAKTFVQQLHLEHVVDPHIAQEYAMAMADG